jgi:ABC-type branched-subunit amino acid transport system ATPase component
MEVGWEVCKIWCVLKVLDIERKGYYNQLGKEYCRSALFRRWISLFLTQGCLLSGGEQKMPAIARALMCNPEILLLDEPIEGLASLLVRALEEQIKKLQEAGLIVLLAEQNVRSALGLGDRDYIIDNGQIRYQGSIEELRENEEVRKKYLLV